MTNYLIIAIILLQLGDFWTTKVALSRNCHESNPVVLFCMSKLGTLPGLFIAKVWAAVVLVTAAYYHTFDATYGLVILSVVTMFYLWVVVHNFLLLRG
jgi:hypothetical protein